MNGYKRHSNDGTAAVVEKKWKEKVKGKEYEGNSGKEHCEGKTGKKCVEKNNLKEKGAGKKAKRRKFKGNGGRNGSKGRSGKGGSSRDKQLV